MLKICKRKIPEGILVGICNTNAKQYPGRTHRPHESLDKKNPQLMLRTFLLHTKNTILHIRVFFQFGRQSIRLIGQNTLRDTHS